MRNADAKLTALSSHGMSYVGLHLTTFHKAQAVAKLLENQDRVMRVDRCFFHGETRERLER